MACAGCGQKYKPNTQQAVLDQERRALEEIQHAYVITVPKPSTQAPIGGKFSDKTAEGLKQLETKEE